MPLSDEKEKNNNNKKKPRKKKEEKKKKRKREEKTTSHMGAVHVEVQAAHPALLRCPQASTLHVRGSFMAERNFKCITNLGVTQQHVRQGQREHTRRGRRPGRSSLQLRSPV